MLSSQTTAEGFTQTPLGLGKGSISPMGGTDLQRPTNIICIRCEVYLALVALTNRMEQILLIYGLHWLDM